MLSSAYKKQILRIFMAIARVPYAPRLIEAVVARDGKVCRYCGKKGLTKKTLTLDHIIPVSKGGQDIRTNMVVCCRVCNCKKNSKDLEAYVTFRLQELEREKELLLAILQTGL